MPTPRSDRSQQGSFVAGSTQPRPERPYRRYESSPVPESLIAQAARVGLVSGLREAAERNDAEHIAGIATGGLAYVQIWLTSLADAIENREFDKEADGHYEHGEK